MFWWIGVYMLFGTYLASSDTISNDIAHIDSKGVSMNCCAAVRLHK